MSGNVRQFLTPPYNVRWQATEQAPAEEIIQHLVEFLAPMKRTAKRGKTEAKQTDEQDRTDRRRLKSTVIIGSSKVLKLLQQKKLTAAIFDKQMLRPHAIAYHVGLVALSSGAHCGCLNINKPLSGALNYKSVSGLGFLKFTETPQQAAVVELLKRRMSAVKAIPTIESAIEFCSSGHQYSVYQEPSVLSLEKDVPAKVPKLDSGHLEQKTVGKDIC